jgi:hypothetical protein
MQVAESGGTALGFTSELKFVVDTATGQRIREWARERLGADPHGNGTFADEYRVSSVYFDTEARDVFMRRGSYGRSKYRIRRYEQDSTVFLERKLRTGSRLAKRRTGIDVAMLPLIAGTSLNGDATAWFRRRLALRALQPVCQVTYSRLARMGHTPDGPARLTLDEGLQACISSAYTFVPHPDVRLLEGQAIVEMKYRGRVPSVFKEAVETFALTPGRWSKYRSAVVALGLGTIAADDAQHGAHA